MQSCFLRLCCVRSWSSTTSARTGLRSFFLLICSAFAFPLLRFSHIHSRIQSALCSSSAMWMCCGVYYSIHSDVACVCTIFASFSSSVVCSSFSAFICAILCSVIMYIKMEIERNDMQIRFIFIFISIRYFVFISPLFCSPSCLCPYALWNALTEDSRHMAPHNSRNEDQQWFRCVCVQGRWEGDVAASSSSLLFVAISQFKLWKLLHRHNVNSDARRNEH